MDHAARLRHLRAALADATAATSANADALAVTSLTNIRYLSGFTGSAGMLLVLPGDTVLVTDGRYELQAGEQLGAAGVDARLQVAPAVRQREAVSALVAEAGPRALALEAAQVSWARQREMAGEWFPGLELVPTVGLVEGLRRVKDGPELARLQAAAEIADQALGAVRPLLAGGPTEAQVALALENEMRRLGADGPAFETICASGPNAAKPHHRTSARPIHDGEPVVIDLGAAVDGYRSDMTRTLWVGTVDDADLRRAIKVVAEAQAAGVGAVAAGADCREVDRACREVIAAAGWADRFVHGTGHGVGLDIHEAPSLAPTSADTLAAGHVVTVEPGVYLPGVGGVRIEDTVVVTGGGCRALTAFAKDLP